MSGTDQIPTWAPRCLLATVTLLLGAGVLLAGWLLRANCFTEADSVRYVARSVWPADAPAGFEPVLAAEMFATRVAVFRSGRVYFVAAAQCVGGRPAGQLLELVERACHRVSEHTSAEVRPFRLAGEHPHGSRRRKGTGTPADSRPNNGLKGPGIRAERLAGSPATVQVNRWRAQGGEQYVSAAVLISDSERGPVVLAFIAPQRCWEQGTSKLFDRFLAGLRSGQVQQETEQRD